MISDNAGGPFLWFVSFGHAKEMNAQRQRRSLSMSKKDDLKGMRPHLAN